MRLIAIIIIFIFVAPQLQAQKKRESREVKQGSVVKNDSLQTKAQIENQIVLSSYSQNPDKALTDYYLRGKEALVTKNNSELAFKYFLKALSINPNHAASNYEIATLLPPEKALPHSLKANESETVNKWYRGQLTDIYAQMQNFDMAIKCCKELIELDNSNDDAYKQLASYYFYAGDIDRAMSIIDTISNRFGESAELALLHTNMIKNLRSPSAAMVKSIHDYISLYTDIPLFTLALGDVYMRMGLDGEAVKCYERVKEIDSEELRGDVALFEYYNRKRNEDEIVKYLSSLFRVDGIAVKDKIEIYKEMIANNIYYYRNYFSYVDDASMTLMMKYPDNMEVRMLYVGHLIKKGDVHSALAFSKTGIDSGYFDLDTYMFVAQAEAFLQRPDSVDKYLDKALVIFPEKASEINLSKASHYVERKEYENALKIMQREVKVEKNDSILSSYYGFIGDIYYRVPNIKASYSAYKKALKYDSQNIVVLNNYSYHLSEENRELEKALKMMEIVIEKEPSNPTYIDTYGWILYQLGRYEEAKKALSKAVALDTSKSSTLLLHYGDVLYKLGFKILANEYWEKALEFGESKEVVEQRKSQK